MKKMASNEKALRIFTMKKIGSLIIRKKVGGHIRDSR